MLLHRFSSPWVLDLVSSLLWPVTTISTTTATGELLQPRAEHLPHFTDGFGTWGQERELVGVQVTRAADPG